VPNEAIERELGLSEGFIEKSVGVAARRVARPGMTVVQMAVEACRALFRRHPVDIGAVDYVIYCGVSREYLEPATAAFIAKELGMLRAGAFDVSSACLGFVDAWLQADALIQLGRAKQVLIVAAERTSSIWRKALQRIRAGDDPTKLLACFTLGDGAAAMLLTAPRAGGSRLTGLSGIRVNFSEHSHLCTLAGSEVPMETNSRDLFNAALDNSPPVVAELLESTGWRPDEVDLVIPHQASRRAIEQGARQMGFAMNRLHITLDRFANLAAVAVPFTLAEALEVRGSLPRKILLAGYGSGLGVGAICLTSRAA
jgi:3-oxoacyl-[acyl-carrier-protein] synthase-3